MKQIVDVLASEKWEAFFLFLLLDMFSLLSHWYFYRPDDILRFAESLASIEILALCSLDCFFSGSLFMEIPISSSFKNRVLFKVLHVCQEKLNHSNFIDHCCNFLTQSERQKSERALVLLMQDT